MLEMILARLGLPFLISTISKALGKLDNQTAKTASDSLKKVEEAIEKGSISVEQAAEANRHVEELVALETEKLKEINTSLRAEVASNDPYVRRMRPTFGYLMALTWAAQMFAVAYVMVCETEKASLVISAIESLSAIWAVGLSVLGIYVYKRSEDKKIG